MSRRKSFVLVDLDSAHSRQGGSCDSKPDAPQRERQAGEQSAVRNQLPDDRQFHVMCGDQQEVAGSSQILNVRINVL